MIERPYTDEDLDNLTKAADGAVIAGGRPLFMGTALKQLRAQRDDLRAQLAAVETAKDAHYQAMVEAQEELRRMRDE